MTSMPLARVYSPVWEQMTLYLPLLGDSAMASVNPCRRSAATEEPTVPPESPPGTDRRRHGESCLSSHILVNPIEGISTLLQGVGKDVGHIQRGVRSHAAVHQDHRDPGVLGLLQDRIPAGLHDGAEGDHIHVRCDEGADGLDLVLLLLLCVGELEVTPAPPRQP